MCCGNEAGSYLRLVDSCITQLKAQGPARACDESKEEEEEEEEQDDSSTLGRGGSPGGDPRASQSVSTRIHVSSRTSPTRKRPNPIGPPLDTRHRPTVGS